MTMSQLLATEPRTAAFLAHLEVSYVGTTVSQGPVLQQ
jgi:hypothetical protein